MNKADSHWYSDSSPDEDDTRRSSDEECSDFDLSTKKRLGKINDCQIFTMSKLAKGKAWSYQNFPWQPIVRSPPNDSWSKRMAFGLTQPENLGFRHEISANPSVS